MALADAQFGPTHPDVAWLQLAQPDPAGPGMHGYKPPERKHFFINRVAPVWNSLQDQVVNAVSLNICIQIWINFGVIKL